MKRFISTIALVVLAACGSVKQSISEQSLQAHDGEKIAKGTYLIRGHFIPGTQPDGNSVLLETREGWLVVDTGRHRAHTEKILALAKESGKPIVAIANTHWHLDHVGGNILVRAAYPNSRVFATNAIEGASKGFLADYRKQLIDAQASIPADSKEAEGYRGEVALIDAGSQLFPTERVDSGGKRSIAGRTLTLGVENAATRGDLWLFDASTGVLISGDLVTLPVPFLDTACPERWSHVLAALEQVPFRILIPGHGEPMNRAGLTAYRTAFDSLRECSASDRKSESCVDDWIAATGSLDRTTDKKFARSLAAYYVDLLRSGSLKANCAD